MDCIYDRIIYDSKIGPHFEDLLSPNIYVNDFLPTGHGKRHWLRSSSYQGPPSATSSGASARVPKQSLGGDAPG